jgi:hypothetical protein
MLFTIEGASIPVSMQCHGWEHDFISLIINYYSKLRIKCIERRAWVEVKIYYF